MTIQDLKDKNLILYECISGSKAYGLDTPTSDTDIKGVFLLPKEQFYGVKYIAQVTDEKNDTIYYELGRFIELLEKSNPNILEMLATPTGKILVKHPIMNRIDPTLFISKKCKDSFGGYAFQQIKKARGLNKKIVNPIEKRKKTILEFCQVLYGQGSIPLEKWLSINSYQQADCGLVDITRVKDVYGLYVDVEKRFHFKGILQKEQATTVLLSSVPKGEGPIGHLYFNQDGYTKYCKEYSAYWNWVDNRNEARYEGNIAHKKNYDSKNMMHTFRLLDMATEILETGKIIVERPNRTELLAIRQGVWEYDDLIEKANEKMARLEVISKESKLQAQPNKAAIAALLFSLRMELYE